MKLSSQHRTWLGIVILTLLIPPPAFGDSCAPQDPRISSASPVGSITLEGQNMGRESEDDAIANAASWWNQGCPGYDNPTVSADPGGAMTVQVNFYQGDAPSNGFGQCNGCACTQTMISNGRVSGAVVQMFSQQPDGVSCLTVQEELLRHEIGHIFGLRDPAGDCSGRIMGDIFASLAAEDCLAVDGVFDNDKVPNEEEKPGEHGPCAV